MRYTIVVTGATGFAGSHVIEALMRLKHREIDVVAACRDRRKLLPQFNGEVREGDLNDSDYLDRVLTGADIVCHCAAWSTLYGKAAQSQKLFLEPSLALIDKALEWRVKRFVFVSSASVAAPQHSQEALSPGIKRRWWPHLNHLIDIENAMRDNAQRGMSMVCLRMGVFAGKRYSLGLLPLVLPRLKTRLWPWLSGGKGELPLIAGEDVAQAMIRAALAPSLQVFESINIAGPEVPTHREVLDYICSHYPYPRPWYSLPLSVAWLVATALEWLHKPLRRDPLLTRSLLHWLRDTRINNVKAEQLLGYKPEVHWKQAVDEQLQQMRAEGFGTMSLSQPVNARNLGDFS